MSTQWLRIECSLKFEKKIIYLLKNWLRCALGGLCVALVSSCHIWRRTHVTRLIIAVNGILRKKNTSESPGPADAQTQRRRRVGRSLRVRIQIPWARCYSRVPFLHLTASSGTKVCCDLHAQQVCPETVILLLSHRMTRFSLTRPF